MRIQLMLIVIVIALLNFSIASAQTKAATNRALFENRGSLHEAAKAAGGRFVTSSTNLNGSIEYQDIKSLKRESSFVVVGTAVTNTCQLTPDGREVQTAYQFRVEDVFKGHARAGDMITVLLPGGRVSFEDGSMVQINTPGFRLMVNGDRYVLFLRADHTNKAFLPTGGSQGIFELQTDGTVVAHAQKEAVGKQSGKRELDFLDQLRSQAEGGKD